MTQQSAHMVDVAINVYGKPYQTAVSLLSLIRHSGQHISKVYIIVERKQPHAINIDFLLQAISHEVEVYRPSVFLWTYPMKYFRPLLHIQQIRYAIRYQYAWEKSKTKYLFITHNDVLYKKDVIGYFLQNVGEHIGIGQVGMCWNCPAYAAELCNCDNHLNYRPSKKEYEDLIKRYPSERNNVANRFRHKNAAWPLPECRLNEWVCMINLDKAIPLTMPVGDIVPFGTMMLDVGTEWFHMVHQLGETVKNIKFGDYAEHGWAGNHSGHAALFNKSLYDNGEEKARKLLAEEYLKGLFNYYGQ